MQFHAALAVLAARQHGDAGALVLQEALGDRPAFVEAADQVLLLGNGVVEEGLAEGRGAGDQADGPHGDAGLMHGEEHEADALVLGHVRIRAHQAENPVGVVGAGGPDLLAIDDEVIAVVFGASAQRRQIRAGTRFRIALAPPHFAASDFRQVAGLLFVGAVFQKRGADHRRAHACHRRSNVQGAHLLQQRHVVFFVQAGAAVLLRPGRHGESPIRAAFQPLPLVRRHRHLGAAARHFARPPTRFRTVGIQPIVNFASE